MSEALREEEGFVIDNDQKAEWALMKIREKNQEKDKWKEHYKKLYETTAAQIDNDISGLEMKLMGYFRECEVDGLCKQTKTQRSYTLPSGKLIIKKQEPEYNRDDDKVIEWLKKNMDGQFIKVKEELDWKGLKAATVAINGGIVTDDGEIVDGIEVHNRDDKFVVEVK